MASLATDKDNELQQGCVALNNGLLTGACGVCYRMMYLRRNESIPMAKMCQSCMMPLSKDPQHGGTETNGSKSSTYCSFCYQNGEFTQKDITAEQMQSFVAGKLQEGGLPKFIAKFFTRGIPKLERWRNV